MSPRKKTTPKRKTNPKQSKKGKGPGWHGESEQHRQAALKRYNPRIKVTLPSVDSSTGSITPPKAEVRKELRKSVKVGPGRVDEIFGGVRSDGGYVGVRGGTKNIKGDVSVSQTGKVDLKDVKVKKPRKKSKKK